MDIIRLMSCQLEKNNHSSCMHSGLTWFPLSLHFFFYIQFPLFFFLTAHESLI